MSCFAGKQLKSATAVRGNEMSAICFGANADLNMTSDLIISLPDNHTVSDGMQQGMVCRQAAGAFCVQLQRRWFPVSQRNLKYMRAFAEAWPETEFVQEALA